MWLEETVKWISICSADRQHAVTMWLTDCWSRLLTTRHWLRCVRQQTGTTSSPRTNRRFGVRTFSVAAPNLEQSTHRPQDCYLVNGRFQTSLEDLDFQKGLRLTFRLLLLQLFFQCFCYYHYHLRYDYRCHHCYHHRLMLCAIGLYMYCRRRSRSDYWQMYL